MAAAADPAALLPVHAGQQVALHEDAVGTVELARARALAAAQAGGPGSRHSRTGINTAGEIVLLAIDAAVSGIASATNSSEGVRRMPS